MTKYKNGYHISQVYEVHYLLRDLFVVHRKPRAVQFVQVDVNASFIWKISLDQFTCPGVVGVCRLFVHMDWAEHSVRPPPTPNWPHTSPQQLEDRQATLEHRRPPVAGRDSEGRYRGGTRSNWWMRRVGGGREEGK